MKRILKKAGKIAAITVALIMALTLILWGALNILKFAIYSEYYSMESELCKNPGLSDGFVCQGIAASEEDGVILVSGYMADKSNSRIYVTDLESNSYYVSLTREGKKYTGHAGGIALTGDVVYIANAGKLFILSLSDILAAENGDILDIGKGVEVNNDASFVFADERYVYVGEFHDGGKYVKDHPYETPDGKNHAIITRYKHTNLSSPDKIYSVRDTVQGVAFAPDGTIVLSTSHGLASSVYYVYHENDAIDSGLTLDGAPVYYLTNLKNKIKGPAMSEDMDYSNGSFITLTESASDKYLFGKFFFANDIISLEIE